MTYGGHGGGETDPFGPDPFGGPSTAGPPPPITHASTGPGFPAPGLAPPPTPGGEVNTLATLSIVFAFVFAPVGAALGHVALSQIRQRGERGRDRALIGLTLSYVIIALALIALVVWLLLGSGSESSPSVTTQTTTVQTPTTAASPPPPRTTVITRPPQQRPTVAVEDLRVGDCVEVQQTEPDPTRGPDTNIINIFPVECQVRDGVFRVDQVLSTSGCPGQTLFNKQETVFACISNYRG